MSKVLCIACGQILESTYRHDYQVCGCENSTSIDGGSDYIKCGGKDLSKIYIWNEQERSFKACVGGHELRIELPDGPS